MLPNLWYEGRMEEEVCTLVLCCISSNSLAIALSAYLATGNTHGESIALQIRVIVAVQISLNVDEFTSFSSILKEVQLHGG